MTTPSPVRPFELAWIPPGTAVPNPDQYNTLQCNYIIMMKSLRFVWDPAQAESNLRKHDVSFAEAQTVIYDENAI